MTTSSGTAELFLTDEVLYDAFSTGNWTVANKKPVFGRKLVVRAESKYYGDICTETLRNTAENLSQSSVVSAGIRMWFRLNTSTVLRDNGIYVSCSVRVTASSQLELGT
jgi:hypothetical protein